MTTEQYRDLIDACYQWRTSLMSAVTAHEQRTEHLRLMRAVEELRGAYCPHLRSKDNDRASRCLATCDELLAAKKQEFDVALSNMAFGEEWR